MFHSKCRSRICSVGMAGEVDPLYDGPQKIATAPSAASTLQIPDREIGIKNEKKNTSNKNMYISVLDTIHTIYAMDPFAIIAYTQKTEPLSNNVHTVLFTFNMK